MGISGQQLQGPSPSPPISGKLVWDMEPTGSVHVLCLELDTADVSTGIPRKLVELNTYDWLSFTYMYDTSLKTSKTALLHWLSLSIALTHFTDGGLCYLICLSH